MSKKSSLTAAFIKNKKEPGRYYDNQNTGLHLYVRGRSKTYVQRTRLNGKSIDISIGSTAKVSLADARAIAHENSRLILEGTDPRTVKVKQKPKPTFKEITEQALLIKLEALSNAKHRAQWRSTLETHAFPTLGNMPVDEITNDHVRAALEPIWNAKRETARRLRSRIEYVFDHAIARGHARRPNPAEWKGNLQHLLQSTKGTSANSRGPMPSLQLVDVQRWWKELKQRDGNGAHALKLLALVAARSGEVRGMQFDEIELYSAPKAEAEGYLGVWRIPAHRMKARREHEIPITQAVFELIEAQPRESSLVFPAKRGGMLSDMTLSAVMKRIHQSDEVGFIDQHSKRPAVPHGLRSTFRSWAAETRQGYDIAELQLAHRIGSSVEQAYNRSNLLKLRADMMSQWFNFLEGIDLPYQKD